MSLSPLLNYATPLEDHLDRFGLLVKREDLSCPPPGPPFSKMRGVIAHMQARYNEGVRLFGVLDTSHSQAGNAVALGARELGVPCINFFPVYKRDIRTDKVPNEVPVGSIQILDNGVWTQLRDPQLRALALGAQMAPLPAGRSAILYHQAKRLTQAQGGYIMPNALKLPEMVQETADEVVRTFEHASREQYKKLRSLPWIIAISSGTIAAGVIRGMSQMLESGARPPVICHMGYTRSRDAVRKYIFEKAGVKGDLDLKLIDEQYSYADKAKAGETPSWPCNPYYDLKAFRWWLANRREGEQAVLWNIG